MSSLKIVSQVGLVSIGADFPFISLDIDAKPSGSRRDWLQRRGRAARAFPAVQGDRSYQEDLIIRARDSIRRGNLPLAVLPCGGGKGEIACKFAALSHAKGKGIGFLTVRRLLVQDMSQRMTRYGVPHGVIMAGYDDTSHRTKIASIHTVIARNSTLDVDLLLVDEAHLFCSGEARAVLDRHAHISRISMTATPEGPGGISLSAIANELILGPSALDLIAQRFLVPSRIFIAHNPNLKGIAFTGSDLNENETARVMNKPGLNGNIVKQWAKLGEDRPSICHAVNVAHSQSIVERFNAAGIPAAHIDASSTDTERQDVFGRLALNAPPKRDFILLDFAGNVLRMGVPEDDQNWSLDSDGTPSLSPRVNALAIRHCPTCLFAFKSTQSVCPNCHAPYVATQKKIIERDKEMTELKRQSKANSIERWRSRLTEDEKLDRLKKIIAEVKAKQYKPGAAFARYKVTIGEEIPAKWRSLVFHR